MCEMIVTFLDDAMINNKDDALEFIDDVCYILPTSWEDECKTVVDFFGEQLIDEFLLNHTPDVVCTNINLC